MEKFTNRLSIPLLLLLLTLTAPTLTHTGEGQLYISGGLVTAMKFSPMPGPFGMVMCKLNSEVHGADPHVGSRPLRGVESWSFCSADAGGEENRLCKLTIVDLTITSRGGKHKAVENERSKLDIYTYGWRGDVKLGCIGEDQWVKGAGWRLDWSASTIIFTAIALFGALF